MDLVVNISCQHWPQHISQELGTIIIGTGGPYQYFKQSKVGHLHICMAIRWRADDGRLGRFMIFQGEGSYPKKHTEVEGVGANPQSIRSLRIRT